jgi:imidazolonepropionase-like amidohydrolase
LYGGHESYRATDVLKSSGLPLLVSLKWPERNRDADPEEPEPLRTLELRDKAPVVPSILTKAEVPFAFYSDGIADPRDVLKAVRRAIDAGLPLEAAVRAMTLAPAQIYGVSERLGSIDKGKIANLIVTRGDLFDEKTRLEYVFVDGVKFQPPAEAPAPGEAPSK